MDCRPHSKGNLSLKAMASPLLGMLVGCQTYFSLNPALPMTSSVTLGKKLSFHICKIRMLGLLELTILVPSNMVCLCFTVCGWYRIHTGFQSLFCHFQIPNPKSSGNQIFFCFFETSWQQNLV